ncbi:glycosyltransferase involved in cell wall biosynthesis [Peribacillus sp. B2I2]|uniref:glycosyltransferase family 2 protein n=1 Tax=Peribacillus sp. B2I2 TaxID=3156468 RepID=UPI003514CC45
MKTNKSILNPKITVFMPVYNTELYIEESIMSILNQTFSDFELLIIDDGSTDRSLDIIRSIKDSRIRLVQNDVNKGLPYTRNLGLKLAAGEYFAVMDSDDIARRDRLERQVNFLQENNNIPIIASNYILQYGNGKFRKSSLPIFNKNEMKIQLLFRNYILNSSAMVRKEFLTENNISYDLRFFSCQDYMFWNECSKYGYIYTDQEFLITYRTGHENTTKVTKLKRKDDRKELVDYIHKDLLEYYGFTFNTEELQLFNNVFGEENLLDSNCYERSIQLLNKMIIQNSQLKLFKEADLRKVIQYNFLLTLIKSECLSNLDKFKLFFNSKTWFTKNIRWFNYFFLRLIKKSMF